MNDYDLGKIYYIGTLKVRYNGEVGAQLMFTPVDAVGKATAPARPINPTDAPAQISLSSGGAVGSQLLLAVNI